MNVIVIRKTLKFAFEVFSRILKRFTSNFLKTHYHFVICFAKFVDDMMKFLDSFILFGSGNPFWSRKKYSHTAMSTNALSTWLSISKVYVRVIAFYLFEKRLAFLPVRNNELRYFSETKVYGTIGDSLRL